MSLLRRLAEIKGQFGDKAAREAIRLLELAKSAAFRDPEDLIQLHESVLYLRAYPQTPRVLDMADEILFEFAKRLHGIDRTPFEYADISGIAGTGLATNFSYPFARSLAERHRGAVNIDWTQYKHTDRLASTLARKIPAAREDWAIAPHADWRRWYESAGGTVEWLMEGMTPEVYDLLELPLRWELGDSNTSRSRGRIPRRKIFYHDAPFLTRRDVSIETELAGPPIRVRRLSTIAAQKILATIIDVSAVRYRELYGFLYPDADRVFHADLGRGVDLFFCGVQSKYRLPSREYCAGMYFKNGVPIGYVEVMWPRRPAPAMARGASRPAARDHGMEVGFNLYYTFRQGETAWLYVRLLKLFRQQFGVDTFFADPYQIGHENDEAIDSGAFWFYHKLGFRSESGEIEKLVTWEERKIAADPVYRTPKRVLRKLAAKPVVYKVP